MPRHLALKLVWLSVLSGVSADLLLRVTPWGLNVSVLLELVALLTACVLNKAEGVTLDGEGRYLVLAALFFAACLAWRDSPTLNVANWLALACALGLALLTARAGQVRRAGSTQYALGLLYVLLRALAGLFPWLRHEVAWRRYRWWSAPAMSVGRGVALAIPPVLVFGGLFMAADADFDSLVRTTFSWNGPDVAIHMMLVLGYAWVIGGGLREMLIAPLRPAVPAQHGIRLSMGIVEIAVVLGVLDLLFLVFVVLQLPYLFGGTVQVAHMGYSEYARRGFFELVWVAGLCLPLLLLTHWLLRSARPSAVRVYRVLASGLICLLFVIMASAVQRMQLYVADSGLTELRVQASAAMAWICVVLVWFVATVLRDRRQHFAFGALLSAFIVIGALDVINPDDQIVRTNTHLTHLTAPGASFDARPFASFSPDATPAIVASLPSLDAETRQWVQLRLAQRETQPSDWRTFNLSRTRASEALQTQ